MTSSEYWAKREAEALKSRITDEKEYDKQLKRIYSDMLDACQAQINAFYGKYAGKEGITLAEAKKRVSELDIKAYERKAKRYVREKDFSAKANEEMRLYNATMKINRLEMLKANIGLELISGHEELDKFMESILQGRTEDELKRQAGILGKTIKNNAKKANAIVNGSFHNATFSDRVWMYQDLMKADLSKLLQSGLIQGKNPRVLARELKQTFKTSTFNAERLMRTELARVQTEAQKQSYLEDDIEEYTFIANGGCCSICMALNGKRFKVSKMMPGENAPPVHPHCRCSTAPFFDRKAFDELLNFIDKGGTTEEWNKIQTIRKSTESGAYLGQLKRIGTNDVNLEYIKSDEFRNKFNRITDNSAVNNSLRQYAEAMLTHRKGTDGEDLYIIDANTGKLIMRKTTGTDNLGVSLTWEEVEGIRKNHFGNMIALHNHPSNVPPTGSDYCAAGYRGYKMGLVITHDGRVYMYKAGEMSFLPELFDKRVDKYIRTEYNISVEEAYKRASDEFEKEYGISWIEI